MEDKILVDKESRDIKEEYSRGKDSKYKKLKRRSHLIKEKRNRFLLKAKRIEEVNSDTLSEKKRMQ